MDRVKMTVEMQVTPAQGLALQAMFEHWNLLSDIGSSRDIGFYVDGDGSFHPKCLVRFDSNIPDLTDEFRKISVVKEKNGNRVYDFDPVGWKINH
jgi:hypothetical protein